MRSIFAITTGLQTQYFVGESRLEAVQAATANGVPDWALPNGWFADEVVLAPDSKAAAYVGAGA